MTPTKLTLISALCVAVAAPSLAFAFGGKGHGDHERGPMASFEMMDIDGNGEITADELKEMGKTRFATIDANQDGFVTLEEMTAHRETQMEGKRAKMAKRMFSRLDANDDGKLSAEEMAKPQMEGKLIKRLDTDGNGTISKAEFDAKAERMSGKRGHGKGGDHNCDDKES